MTSLRSRRNLLQLSGMTVALTLIAGCATLADEEQGLVLGGLSVRNAHPEAHTVRVELERDGELVEETTVDVPGDGGVAKIEPAWDATPAEYTLRYVIFGPDEDPDIRTRTLTAEDAESDDQDCTVAAITIGFPDETHPYVSVGPPGSLEGSCPE